MFSTITHESLSLAVPTHDVRKTRPAFTEEGGLVCVTKEGVVVVPPACAPDDALIGKIYEFGVTPQSNGELFIEPQRYM